VIISTFALSAFLLSISRRSPCIASWNPHARVGSADAPAALCLLAYASSAKFVARTESGTLDLRSGMSPSTAAIDGH
jgi:hypothetical protein